MEIQTFIFEMRTPHSNDNGFGKYRGRSYGDLIIVLPT